MKKDKVILILEECLSNLQLQAKLFYMNWIKFKCVVNGAEWLSECYCYVIRIYQNIDISTFSYIFPFNIVRLQATQDLRKIIHVE